MFYKGKCKMLVKFCSLIYNNSYNKMLGSSCLPKNYKGVESMQEDFFAKTRNGHLLVDLFDKQNNTLDIRSNGLYPSNVLSNLAHKPFVFDGISCASIEGFLQSLKVKDSALQARICGLYGGSAKNISKKYNNWHKFLKLYWQRKEYLRNSSEYFDLVSRAYKECYNTNPIFKEALDSTKGVTLTHKMGNSDKNKTVLTSQEFIRILTSLRDGI